jgi:hypothetical protein
MRNPIEILLRFNCQTSDGTVTGYGRMATFIEGELPRIGERIRPCTEDSHINLITDYYELVVINVCRNVGGNYTQPVLCEVKLATWNPYSGKLAGVERTKEQVIKDWENLVEFYKYNWNEERREGTAIPVLNIKLSY